MLVQEYLKKHNIYDEFNLSLVKQKLLVEVDFYWLASTLSTATGWISHFNYFAAHDLLGDCEQDYWNPEVELRQSRIIVFSITFLFLVR